MSMTGSWRGLLASLLAGAILAGSLSAQDRAAAPVLVIEGGTLIDGTGRAPVKDVVIIIKGARIEAVGARGSVEVPAGAQTIDAAGQTILPGLIDAHVHFLDFTPLLFLHHGVTTVFDTANPTEWILAQREALRRGRILGPRLFSTGLIIDGPAVRGGAADSAELGGYKIRVQNAEQARVATRNLIRQGVDAIKVHEQLSAEQLAAVIEEARGAGLQVVGHVADLHDAVRVGMKFIEHSEVVVEALRPATGPVQVPEADMDTTRYGEVIDLLVRNEVFFNPTISRSSLSLLPKKEEWSRESLRLLEDPSAKFIPEARLQFWLREARAPAPVVSPALAERRRQGLNKLQEFVRRFAQAGGKVITGPDTGSSSGPTNLPGLSMHVEMETLVDAGLTPMQAILASTRWPAELMHRDKDLGTVEAGKLADLILIEGDPLTDIRTTRNVRTVILDGKIAETRLDPAFRNPMPRAVALDSVLEYMGPRVAAMAPRAGKAGGERLNLQITGDTFSPRSVVRFDTTDLPTTFVSSEKLTASIGATLLRNPGTYAVIVVNPGSGGGTSRVLYFVVSFPD